MHKDNFVVCVKVDGKILREKDEKVALPFGSEYSIYLKNLENRRAMVRVSVDGECVTGERWLVVGSKGNLDTLELERSIQNNNLEQGNRFKFIERTQAVEEGRGIKAEDGLISVEVKKEQQVNIVHNTIVYHDWYWYPYYHWRYPYIAPTYPVLNDGTWTSGVQSSSGSVLRSASSGSIQACNMSQSQQFVQNSNDAGITVPGSLSSQKFQDTLGFPTESNSRVITLHLVGRLKDESVEKPRTVDVRPVCITCKKVNQAISNFCSRCGTSLLIL